MVIDVGTPGKVVSSACYDVQQVCVYLQPTDRQTDRQTDRHAGRQTDRITIANMR